MFGVLLQVAAGGAIGAAARHLAGILALRLAGAGFPWGTLAVNVVGCLLMGLLHALLQQRGASHLAPFLLTGMLGGFTTFSAFSLEVALLVERGAMLSAAAYVLASVALSLAAVAAGLALVRGHPA